MRLGIFNVGEPILRNIARPLQPEEIGTKFIRELIGHMRETLIHAPGVGLAAPQIGEDLQLAIVEDKVEYQANLSSEELSERGRRPVEFHVLINPEIELLSPLDVTFFEGCLSLPGFVAMVPRAQTVRVRALNEVGESMQIEAEGWYARILQHEIDHLRGTLYIDRMWSRSFSCIDNYSRYLKGKSTAELVHNFSPARPDAG